MCKNIINTTIYTVLVGPNMNICIKHWMNKPEPSISISASNYSLLKHPESKKKLKKKNFYHTTDDLRTNMKK